MIPKQRVIKDEAAYLPGLLGIVSTLFDRGVQFATIDDTDLDRIPTGPHVLIYLDPEYAVPEALAKLQARAEAGDDVFITGDFSRPLDAGGARQTELFSRLGRSPLAGRLRTRK